MASALKRVGLTVALVLSGCKGAEVPAELSVTDPALHVSLRLRARELLPQPVGEARDDLVLHVEEVGDGLVEPLGPDVVTGFGVDQLHVDAHAVPAAFWMKSRE